MSTATPDARARPAGLARRFAATAAGTAAVAAWAGDAAPERVVVESTGPYHKAAVGGLLAGGLPAVAVNARQGRGFAKGLGQLATTDAADAAGIAHAGEVAPTAARPPPAPALRGLRGLSDRRGRLGRMLAAERDHRHPAAGGGPKVLTNIGKPVDDLGPRTHDPDGRVDRAVDTAEASRARAATLRSITGIGPRASRTLPAHLPGLGHRTRRPVAALVGLAPVDDDRGRHTGRRHIRGGRRAVRIGLDQAAAAAIRHCPQMTAYHAALKARGTAPDVATVAVAGELLVLANAPPRDMTPARAPANSAC